jgi:hypothetical protein
MRMKEPQDIIAPFEVQSEVESFDLKCKLGTAIIWMVHSRCPSFSVARDVYNALLVAPTRPESWPQGHTRIRAIDPRARAAPVA